MTLSTGLALKAQQTLTLSPQLEQALQLLALPAVDLRQAIDEALAKNPLLILGEELEGATPLVAASPPVEPEAADRSSNDPSNSAEEELPPFAADASAYWESSGRSWGEDEPNDPFSLIADSEGLTDHLHRQAALSSMDEALRPLVALVIEALDENGYLTTPLAELATWVDPPADEAALAQALEIVQRLEPTGVGARSLAECLLLQLAEHPQSPQRALAEAIVRDHLALLARHDYATLSRVLAVGPDDLKGAVALIERLDPKPGRPFARTTAQTILPDLLIVPDAAGWRVALNPAAYPRVVVAPYYHDQIGRKSSAEWRQLLTEAKQFVKHLEQRAITLLRVGQAIVDRQHRFFVEGDSALAPLTLREIAEAVALHESTVSRTIAGKTMLTPKGVVPLKHFFTARLTTESGAATSNAAIKSRIAALIASESPDKPLSDSEIVARLAAEGIVIARRTVAKYRDALSIPPAALRRRLS